jgi:hypothetical protein
MTNQQESIKTMLICLMTLRNDSLLDADYFEYAELKEKKN